MAIVRAKCLFPQKQCNVAEFFSLMQELFHVEQFASVDSIKIGSHWSVPRGTIQAKGDPASKTRRSEPRIWIGLPQSHAGVREIAAASSSPSHRITFPIALRFVRAHFSISSYFPRARAAMKSNREFSLAA